MAITMNGLANGHSAQSTAMVNKRFSDIPSAVDIPVSGGEIDEVVELELEELPDDPTELCTLLENEKASKNLWMTTSLAYAKQHKIDLAVDILQRGLQTLSQGGPKEKIGLLSLQCWLHLWQSREAPRVAPEGITSEDKTKESCLEQATHALNNALRVDPSFPPLFLARGIHSLLRASLQTFPTANASVAPAQPSRADNLRQAQKWFEHASRLSHHRNMLAILGKARSAYALGRYPEALECYQDVLSKMPDLTDPDPRIGIGCCLWQLGFIEEAREAWERALEMSPDSKVANILISQYYIRQAQKHELNDPEFISNYAKAIKVFVSKAFKMDKDYPLTCATFGNYFLPRQQLGTVESLARKAIEFTDVNAIASDGWFLLARKEHYEGDTGSSKVVSFYEKADMARGDDAKGYLPAKFGAAQAQVRNGDYEGAKFRLDNMSKQHSNLEVKVLLGCLYAQEVFDNQASGFKEDKSEELKRAISYLDTVRVSWKDPKRASSPDMNLLIILSRLYEIEQPEKSLQCLLQVQSMSLANLAEEYQYLDEQDDESRREKSKAHLPAQLLNNIGCFQYQMEKFEEAASNFQIGLNACMIIEKSNKVKEENDNSVSDQLVTTISFNLARSYEASGLFDEAKTVYEGLLNRHAEYTDARVRLAYIKIRQDPQREGPKTMASLFESESRNMEVRALYGWYLSKSKKRTMVVAEDQEQRHYKQTLQQFDKHDQYSLTGMGNIHLTVAREMKRESEQDKDKRRGTYQRSIEFYHKALQLDPRNAYAAQGIGIALAEDKKDFGAAVQVFSKVKDTVKDASVLVNLGHIYAELKQFSKAIENYEAALAKDRQSDHQILACLGRLWLLKGKQERSASAMKTSLDYSRRALEIAPEQIHFKFNIAFVQMQLAQLIYGLPDHQRSLVEVEAAAEGLDQAIDSFVEIAQAKNPPYPRHDLEQRANMGRNTIRKQLERAVQSQRDYEEANASKLAEARRRREEDLKRKEEEKQRAEEELAAQKRRLQEERQKLLDRSRELAAKREEEERLKEDAEWTDNTEGERVKRKARKKAAAGKRKKKGEDESDVERSGAGSDSSAPPVRRKKRTEGEEAPRKKRKLARGKTEKTNSKFKSSEMIDDSDVSDDAAPAKTQDDSELSDVASVRGTPDVDTVMADGDDEEEEEVAVVRPRKKVARLIEDDDEEEEEEAEEEGSKATVNRRADAAGEESE